MQRKNDMQQQYCVEVINNVSSLIDAEEDPTARYQRFIDANDAANQNILSAKDQTEKGLNL